MKKIKKGDYLIVRTNEPMIGFIERFGYGLSTDDVEPEDYVARVQQIIDSNNFLVYIASVGYRCIVSSSEVVGFASEEQLTDEDKKEEKSLFSFLAEPQFVYTNDEEVPGNSIAEKCDYLAKKADEAWNALRAPSAELLTTDQLKQYVEFLNGEL